MKITKFEVFLLGAAWQSQLNSGTPRVIDGSHNMPTAPGSRVEVHESIFARHPEDSDAKLNMFSGDWEQCMCR